MRIEILHRFTRAALFTVDVSDAEPHPWGFALTQAFRSGVSLECADLTARDLRSAELWHEDRRAVLTGADLTDAVLTDAVLTRAVLTGAVLTGADLTDAVLTDAVLTDAVLTDAVLTGADLTDADLTDAVLTDAVLTGAVLTDAVLTGAVLTDAVLTDAVLTRAVLTDAVLTDAERDVRLILFENAAEVPALLAALRAGKVDGSAYRGACACLMGTIANARGCAVESLACDSTRPAERLFLAIRPGNTPENHPVAKTVEAWIVNWLATYGAGEAPATEESKP